ncbi:MAG: amidase, partial [Arenicellales bacterium]|nr:amidase [Arenicellales bacterium]
MSELWKKSAVDMVDLLRSGDISPVEAVQAAISRIETVDGKTNALPIRCFDRAIEQAQTLDLTSHRQNPKSLCGLPIAVKDYNDVAGVRTTYGSPIFKDHIAERSDVTVTVLEHNGANPIAKSNVPEWAGGHTFNPVNGLTRNPWNLSRSAGGSSGGSAAALASGQVWLATGNDLGGSLRTPAAF